jgi:hypothetical protein
VRPQGGRTIQRRGTKTVWKQPPLLNLHFGGYLGLEKFPGGFRAYLVGLPVYGNRYPFPLALAHTKVRFKIDPVMEGFFLDKLLKGLDYIVGPFDVAGTADTDV